MRQDVDIHSLEICDALETNRLRHIHLEPRLLSEFSD